ncbi:MAG: glutamate--tRNA ligase [Kiritimatiellae bacterium]|nr:glutamate--tRNA ligase [Kiritimatiellia bacterium]
MCAETIRTRIAPSPTGAPHIGTAYIALFNYAFAKRHGGEFILRIEDTDQVRSTRASENDILEALEWTGLSWDEGPDKGGDHGPYRQSERLDIYRKHVDRLIASGHAYPCFCSSERLSELRNEQMAAKQEFIGYDGTCSMLDPQEARRRIEAGEPHVVRLKSPADGDCVINDRLREEIRIPWQTIDDQILMKADGFPTYHLANVVDDHLMAITHVIRGEEWISSAPKHVLLYQAFGWTPPMFVHLPLLRNPDKSKLSKRKNPTSILYYRQAGFLPEAVLNYLGLMAYSPADGQEEFTLEQMVATFDLDRVSLGGPIFDILKLRNFNGRYLRALTPEQLYERIKSWMLNDDTWQRVMPIAQPRLEQMTDLVPMSAFLFADRLAYDPELLVGTTGDGDRTARLLQTAQWEFEGLGDWTVERIKDVFMRMSETEDLKLKKLMPLFFIALAGSKVALPVFDSMVVLGKDMCLRRLQYALDSLATVDVTLKGKALKRFTKEYEGRYGRRN